MATTPIGSALTVPNTTASTSTSSTVANTGAGASTISSPGLGSGLDVSGIVSKLMAIESQPVLNLYTREASYQAKISAYGTLQSSLSSLQSAAQALADTHTFQGAAASVSDSTILGATATSTATPGTYTIAVTTLAQAQILDTTSTSYTTATNFNSGTLAITVGTTTTNVAIDSTNNTLSGIATAINKASAGVTASVINDGTTNRLVITAANSGLANVITSITATEDGTITAQSALAGLTSANMNVVQPAADAKFKINGLQITRSSNSVSDVINGVTLNLLKADATGNSLATVTVSANTASETAAINAFVKAYNDVITGLKSASAYDAKNNQASTLTGDSLVLTLESQLSSAVFRSVAGVRGLSSLSDIGISVQKDGTLSVNSTQLQSALIDPTKDVSSLFAQATAGSSPGIGVRFNTLLDGMIGTGGLLPSAQDSANRSITDITNQINTWNLRLTQVQNSYLAEFNALDTMLASMQQTSTYLTQQLSTLPGIKTA